MRFLFWSIIFGLSYTQAPLYYSNQNQYFLHGLAHAGRGDLDQDWLANTKDPTPVFSAGVAFTAKYVHEWMFYAYYILILGLYGYSLLSIYSFLHTIERPFLTEDQGRQARFLFVTMLIALHAGIVRWLSVQAFGVDYPWFFQAGLAGQYVLGFGLQPSVFGVFLLCSVATFLRGRPWLAVTWACLAAVVHGTYMPTAALLTLSYMLLQCRAHGLRAALVLGLYALMLVAPAVIYNALAFAPTSQSAFT